jgi:RNA polymerase sigma-70 factor, ECF subfamily
MSDSQDFPQVPSKERDAPEYGGASMQCEPTRLMLATKRGDPQAFDVLVETLRGRAFHVARALVGSQDDAMELCQETFLRIYKARETFREGEPFLPWFHRILRNTCFSFLRERRRVRSISDQPPGSDGDAGDYEIIDDEAGPSEILASNERAQAFWTAFNALSSRDREILALRHFKELAYRDIAVALDIPEGTVMSRLFHARRRLREGLDTDVFPPEETGAVSKGGRA